MSSLYKLYQTEIRQKLGKELGITNPLAIPKIRKIVINTGLGEALVNKKAIEEMGKQLAVITGQKPIVTLSKHDISAFKLRKGEAIGLKVTLRKKKMYDFLEKMVKIVLPRFRDFRGINNRSFDSHGSYTLGLTEQIVFPEIDYNKIDKIRGMEITFVTTAQNKDETKRLLEMLGLPFSKAASDNNLNISVRHKGP